MTHPRKPCLHCGGEKGLGSGKRWCDACLNRPREAPESPLEALIADQRAEIALGAHIARERVGNGHTGERTLSLDGPMAQGWDAVLGDEWSDPTAEEVMSQWLNVPEWS
jgi:hypothetical protein